MSTTSKLAHIELAQQDLNIAISLRSLCPIYIKFMNKEYDDIIQSELDRLIAIISCQLCDLISLAGLYDLKNQFENAYDHILRADDIIHCINTLNCNISIKRKKKIY